MNLGAMILKFSSDPKPTIISNCAPVAIIQDCLSLSGFSTNTFNKTIYSAHPFNTSYITNSNVTLEFCMKNVKNLPLIIPPNKP